MPMKGRGNIKKGFRKKDSSVILVIVELMAS